MIHFRGLLAVVAALLALAVALPGAAEGKRLALLIGVNKYPNLGSKFELRTSVNDANLLGQRLRTLGFAVETVADPSLDKMIEAVSALVDKVQPEDTVLFYFSGHGVRSDGINLLLPSDIPQLASGAIGKEQARRRAYAESEIIASIRIRMTDAKSGQQRGLIVLISDACRDNPFDDGSADPTKAVTFVEHAVQPKPMVGIFSIYSAGIGQKALDRISDDDPSPNSVFMRAFIEYVDKRGMTLSDMVVSARQHVANLARQVTDRKTGQPYQQVPVYYDETLGGHIYLAGPPIVVAVAPPSPHAPSLPASPPPPSGPVGGIMKPVPKNYVTHDNRDLGGGAYEKKPDLELSACVKACREDGECHAFSYDKWNRWCFLKNKNNIGRLLLEPKALTGIRQDISAPSLASGPTRISRYSEKIFLGDTYRSIKVRSYEKCEPACSDDKACVAFTFLKKERLCKLFKTTTEYFGNEVAESGVKRQIAP
jgi:hypothetical protein